ncbi:hypothetical protein SVIOM342S_05650 [Streptomyces violaceorubidus]
MAAAAPSWLVAPARRSRRTSTAPRPWASCGVSARRSRGSGTAPRTRGGCGTRRQKGTLRVGRVPFCGCGSSRPRAMRPVVRAAFLSSTSRRRRQGQDHPAFGGGEAAPDAVGLGLQQGVLAALDHDRTARADALGGLLAGEARRGRFLGGGEEQSGLVAPAHRLGVPRSVLVPVPHGHPLGRNGSYLQGRMRRLQHGSTPDDGFASERRCVKAYPLYARLCTGCPTAAGAGATGACANPSPPGGAPGRGCPRRPSRAWGGPRRCPARPNRPGR